ncbi:MAG: TolB-like 6-bladed beta-propeller domain-containing protein [Prevotellaceae bacterium]|jgi:hypothetical protein|nr:TolB-like 6-bladed beta-propeller domain-containing protein [Prevotellaceae bacterium]
MRNMLYSFVLLLVISCNHGNINEIVPVIITEFPAVKKELKAKVISVPPVIMTPANLCISDDKLIIIYNKKDTVLDFFQLPECKYLFGAGIRGGGPDDFSPDYDSRFLHFEGNEFNIFSSDGLLKRFTVDYKSKRIYTNKSKNQRLNTDHLGYPVNRFNILNDTLCFCMSQIADNEGFELVMINTKTKRNLQFSPYPDWLGKVWLKDNIPFVYVKNMTSHPSGTKFASFYAYFKRWRIYDYKTNLIREIHVEVPPYSKSVNENTSERMAYYGYSCSTAEYIYVECRNRKVSDKPASDTEIQVWDWDGNPVAVYTLDKKISLFTISEKERKIYALTNEEEDEDKIYVYSIPEH